MSTPTEGMQETPMPDGNGPVSEAIDPSNEVVINKPVKPAPDDVKQPVPLPSLTLPPENYIG